LIAYIYLKKNKVLFEKTRHCISWNVISYPKNGSNWSAKM